MTEFWRCAAAHPLQPQDRLPSRRGGRGPSCIAGRLSRPSCCTPLSPASQPHCTLVPLSCMPGTPAEPRLTRPSKHHQQPRGLGPPPRSPLHPALTFARLGEAAGGQPPAAGAAAAATETHTTNHMYQYARAPNRRCPSLSNPCLMHFAAALLPPPLSRPHGKRTPLCTQRWRRGIADPRFELRPGSKSATSPVSCTLAPSPHTVTLESKHGARQLGAGTQPQVGRQREVLC